MRRPTIKTLTYRCLVLLVLVRSLATEGLCIPQETPSAQESDALAVPQGATQIERSTGSCDDLKYHVAVSYPGASLIGSISAELQRKGWKPLQMDIFNETNDPLPAMWKHWTNVSGGRVHTRKQQWESPVGVVQYKFWYFSPNLRDLSVEVTDCSLDQLEDTRHHVDCKHATVPVDPSFSASAVITKIEPIEKGYKIRFRIENNGTKSFLLSVDGTLEGGFPRLRAGPQQSENGQWNSVGADCFEFPPMTWTTVKPGASVESSTSAIDFPGPNQRFGMCIRKAGHLHDALRVALRYYVSLCDIQDGLLAKKAYMAASEPVEPPQPNP